MHGLLGEEKTGNRSPMSKFNDEEIEGLLSGPIVFQFWMGDADVAKFTKLMQLVCQLREERDSFKRQLAAAQKRFEISSVLAAERGTLAPELARRLKVAVDLIRDARPVVESTEGYEQWGKFWLERADKLLFT